MKVFQQYLASLPPQIYNTTQFLRYYALPYIPDPKTHPSFKEIYHGDWVSQLEKRVTLYVNDPNIKQLSSVPTLIRALSSRVVLVYVMAFSLTE